MHGLPHASDKTGCCTYEYLSISLPSGSLLSLFTFLVHLHLLSALDHAIYIWLIVKSLALFQYWEFSMNVQLHMMQ